MAVLLGVCNWVHPLLQSPSCCKELKEAGIDAIQLDLGSAEEDFPLSSPGIQRQWKEEVELYGIRLDAVAVLAVLKHGMTAEPGSERRNTAEKAKLTKVLAQNQGLYNGFLAAGLFWSLLVSNPDFSRAIATFFLGCVFVAGIYGGLTASKKIIYIQAVPALLALVVLHFA